MKYSIAILLLVIVMALAFGLYYDLGSRPGKMVSATIVEATPAEADYKSASPRAGKVAARLADGTIVTVRGAAADNLRSGQTIELTEMVTPWQTTWYRQREASPSAFQK